MQEVDFAVAIDEARTEVGRQAVRTAPRPSRALRVGANVSTSICCFAVITTPAHASSLPTSDAIAAASPVVLTCRQRVRSFGARDARTCIRTYKGVLRRIPEPQLVALLCRGTVRS